jgi:hypothetical protein
MWSQHLKANGWHGLLADRFSGHSPRGVLPWQQKSNGFQKHALTFLLRRHQSMAMVKTSIRTLWETCLTARIARRINDLSRENETVFAQIRTRARDQAVEELGLAELEAAEARLRDERLALELRQRQLEREQLAVLRGCAPAKIPDADLSLARLCVAQAIHARTDVCELPLLAECAPGRELLELEEERERVLETVLFANSAEQLQALWQRLSERLGEPATPLQRFALGQSATGDT